MAAAYTTLRSSLASNRLKMAEGFEGRYDGNAIPIWLILMPFGFIGLGPFVSLDFVLDNGLRKPYVWLNTLHRRGLRFRAGSRKLLLTPRGCGR